MLGNLYSTDKPSLNQRVDVCPFQRDHHIFLKYFNYTSGIRVAFSGKQDLEILCEPNDPELLDVSWQCLTAIQVLGKTGFPLCILHFYSM